MYRIAIVYTLLLTCSIAFAKDPEPAIPPQDLNALDPMLVKHLIAWEASMRGIQNFVVEATHTKVNLVTQREEKFDVPIWMMKPQMARLSMRKIPTAAQPSNPDSFEAFIRNGMAAYHYEGESKTVTKIQRIGGVQAAQFKETEEDSFALRLERWVARSCFDNLLDFFESFTAQRCVDRYVVKLLKQDANYLYLELIPRNKIDQADFESMTIVLCQPGVRDLAYIPRLIQLKKANGQEIEGWDFPEPKVNSPGVRASDFEYQVPPKGWQVHEIVLPTAVQEVVPISVAPVVNSIPACVPTCTPVTSRRCQRLFRNCRR